MTVEQRKGHKGVGLVSLADKESLSRGNRPGIIKRAAVSAFLTIALPRQERIVSHSGVEYHRDFQKAFQDSILEGYFPILYANHTSYYDGFPLSLVTHDLTMATRYLLSEETFNGYILPVARSLATGHQDYFSQRLYEASVPELAKNNLIPFLLTRDKDKRDYNLSGDLREYIESLDFAIDRGFGYAVFPEGTLEGGRKDSDGMVNGMRQFEPGALTAPIRHLEKKGRRPVLIPVGISGGYKVHPPDEYPSSRAVRAAFWLGNPHLVDVKVGLPVRFEDPLPSLLRTDKERFSNILGKKVAELLPPDERGVYKNSV